MSPIGLIAWAAAIALASVFVAIAIGLVLAVVKEYRKK